MRIIQWSAQDRANELWAMFCVFVAVVLVGLAIVNPGQSGLFYWFAMALMGFQAWVFWSIRSIVGRIDAEGITKTMGETTWTAPWAKIKYVRFATFFGTQQLIVVTQRPVAMFGMSNRLMGLAGVPWEGAAVQLDPQKRAEIEEAILRKGIRIRTK